MWMLWTVAESWLSNAMVNGWFAGEARQLEPNAMPLAVSVSFVPEGKHDPPPGVGPGADVAGGGPDAASTAGWPDGRNTAQPATPAMPTARTVATPTTVL